MRDLWTYLGRIAVIPAALVAVGAAVVWGPWSPLALDRANARYLEGDLQGARAAYAEVADGWHTPATRAEAALRAGLLAGREGDSRAAVTWMHRAVDLEPDAERRAGIRNQLAALYGEALGDPAAAAAQYDQAAVDADDPRLALAAGSWWERAGESARAYAAYRVAAARLAAVDAGAQALARAGMDRTARAGDGLADTE